MVGSKEAVETLRGRCAAAIGSRAEYTRRRESCNAPRAAPNIELEREVSDGHRLSRRLWNHDGRLDPWERGMPWLLLHAAAVFEPTLNSIAFLSSPWPLSVSSGEWRHPLHCLQVLTGLLQKAHFSHFSFGCTIQRYSCGHRPRRVDYPTLQW